MVNRLIFIGVLHGDNRIKKALSKIRPGIITVEMNKQYWNSLVNKNLKESYAEVKETVKYAREKNIPLYFIDKMPTTKTQKKRDKQKSKDYSGEDIKNIYSFFKKHYTHRSRETENILIYEMEEFKERTSYMTKKLEEILKNNKNVIIVHVGGAGHFINPKNMATLFSSMKRHKPKRYLVTDFI